MGPAFRKPDRWLVERRSAANLDPGALPAIVRDGKLNGVWFHSGEIIMANEFTTKNKDCIQGVPFKQILNHVSH